MYANDEDATKAIPALILMSESDFSFILTIVAILIDDTILEKVQVIEKNKV